MDELIENAYYVLAEEDGLPPRLMKHQVHVLAGFPEKGSIVFPIEVQLAATAMIAGHFTPQQVFGLAKQALELFLKLPALFGRDGSKSKEPPIQVRVSGNGNKVTIHVGNTEITTDRQPASVLAKTYRELKELPQQFDRDSVESFELDDGTGEAVEISGTARAKSLTFPKALRDQLVFQLNRRQEQLKAADVPLLERSGRADELEGTGDIISFNKENRTGIIRLLSATEIPPGEYSFEIRSGETTQNFIAAMLQARVKIRFFMKTGRKHTVLTVTWIEKELGARA
jgi:hypothetical protein